jgi:hypothetical protein
MQRNITARDFAGMLLFFNLHECGADTIDTEGRGFLDLATARAMAVRDALSIMSHEVANGTLRLSCHIDIMDQSGNLVDRVMFSDALVVSGQ